MINSIFIPLSIYRRNERRPVVGAVTPKRISPVGTIRSVPLYAQAGEVHGYLPYTLPSLSPKSRRGKTKRKLARHANSVTRVGARQNPKMGIKPIASNNRFTYTTY
jgi:hypothetical protein